MTAYYNEFDPAAAAWIRELIAEGHIAPGDVDERSIEDVEPSDLQGYTQCHFFAGIGGWSLAARLGGWPDDRPIWTGSPPCQPFSTAGRRGGYDDARHLAPAWLDLVSQCRPPVVFGEQVASAASNTKHPWLDDLQDALEAEGYATGAVVLPACGVGAPHIRQRIWFVAQRLDDAASARHDGAEQGAESDPRDETWMRVPSEGRGPGGMGDGQLAGLEGHRRDGDHGHEPGRLEPHPNGSTAEAGGAGGVADGKRWKRDGVTDGEGGQLDGAQAGRKQGDSSPTSSCELRGVADGPVSGRREERADSGGIAFGDPAQGEPAGHGTSGSDHGPSPDHSFWSSCDWIYCRDDKWRPIKRGLKPLVAGLPRGVVPSGDPGSEEYADATAEARVMRLRGFGNAIVPQVGAEVIRALMETMQEGAV